MTALEVASSSEVEVIDEQYLSSLAETAKLEYQRSRDALGQSIDGYLACGRALLEARRVHASNEVFGHWFNAQNFAFNRQWAVVLRHAAEAEVEVREAFASQLANGVKQPNLQKAVQVVRAALKAPAGETPMPEPAKLDKTQEGVRIRESLIRELAERGYNREQIADRVGVTVAGLANMLKRMGLTLPADSSTLKKRVVDPVRIVTETIHALEGLCMGINLIDYSALDREMCASWAAASADCLTTIRQFVKAISEQAGRE